jgi:hypothetical protein
MNNCERTWNFTGTHNNVRRGGTSAFSAFFFLLKGYHIQDAERDHVSIIIGASEVSRAVEVLSVRAAARGQGCVVLYYVIIVVLSYYEEIVQCLGWIILH